MQEIARQVAIRYVFEGRRGKGYIHNGRKRVWRGKLSLGVGQRLLTRDHRRIKIQDGLDDM